MPVHNEAPVIEGVIEGFVTEVAQKFERAEIVVVDDRSTDGTAQLLDEIASGNPSVRVVHAPFNRGHGPTMREAIEQSSGEWIFHADSDGQFDPSDFWLLWDKRGSADLVAGNRVRRHDPRHRLLLSRMVRFAVGLLGGRHVADPNVPFKLFHRKLWEDLNGYIGEDALAPSIMISIGAAVRGWRVKNVSVTHLARTHGTSHLRLWRLFKFSARGLAELLAFRVRLALSLRVGSQRN